MQEFLVDFDPLRTGKVKNYYFRSACSSAGYELSDEQFELLKQKYSPDGEFFNYRQCCDDIDTIFTVKGLEKNPKKTLPHESKEFVVSHRLKFQNFVKKNEEVEELLERLKHDVETRRMLMKPTFHDFDHANNGKISRSNFMRCVVKFFKLTSPELDLLSDHYTDNISGRVNYLQFLKDIGMFLY